MHKHYTAEAVKELCMFNFVSTKKNFIFISSFLINSFDIRLSEPVFCAYMILFNTKKTFNSGHSSLQKLYLNIF
jgi:hypothetical protein